MNSASGKFSFSRDFECLVEKPEPVRMRGFQPLNVSPSKGSRGSPRHPKLDQRLPESRPDADPPKMIRTSSGQIPVPRETSDPSLWDYSSRVTEAASPEKRSTRLPPSRVEPAGWHRSRRRLIERLARALSTSAAPVLVCCGGRPNSPRLTRHLHNIGGQYSRRRLRRRLGRRGEERPT